MIKILKADADAAVRAAEEIEAALSRRHIGADISYDALAIIAANFVELTYEDEPIEAEFTAVIPLEIEGHGEENARE